MPRRAGQAHLEPQLREPGGTGSGTPFDAFDPSDQGDDATPATSAGRAAAFRAATGRAPAPETGARHAAPDTEDAFTPLDQDAPDRDPPDRSGPDRTDLDQADGEPDASR